MIPFYVRSLFCFPLPDSHGILCLLLCPSGSLCPLASGWVQPMGYPQQDRRVKGKTDVRVIYFHGGTCSELRLAYAPPLNVPAPLKMIYSFNLFPILVSVTRFFSSLQVYIYGDKSAAAMLLALIFCITFCGSPTHHLYLLIKPSSDYHNLVSCLFCYWRPDKCTTASSFQDLAEVLYSTCGKMRVNW